MGEYRSGPERFHERYRKLENTCWEWIGAISSSGYGYIKVNQISWTAPKYSYYIHKGHIPEGYYVCHTCDNPLCVNPNHLFLGTPLENMADMIKKGRQKRTKYPLEMVLAIRADTRKQRVIAADYGISQSNVSKIKRRDSYLKTTETD